ncbi:4Fe-4S dicluster domain-containing protein [Vallitalea guaymasensis]|uniref:4Fe-4S dicluster domain-containing protein n=1 Tax=Vallitalea guaymasensis TaxID=1185412 RepID=A0A8J8M7N1_9FIRM|nr:4Fe-4S dicluster domain-containing protein [Vallitalea guaymasensis]QUH27680.1 4Fe-4S dicluster domain-containing protein [Vallitalea guaymasensis]
MRKFETNVQLLKYKVLKEVASSALNNTLEKDILDIPNKIIPGPKPETRCCIYKERAIINERVKLAMGGDADNDNTIQVIDMACDSCPIQKYSVTEACRGCIAHKCKEACPFDAIDFSGQKAHIDTDKCKECGRCANACPYNAIIEIQRPCVKACNADAISIDPDTKKASIDYENCISCGACVYQCPFGAIMDKSSIVDVIRLIEESAKNNNYKVYAMIAPAISSQFTYAKIEQVITGIKKLGFHNVVEVALGADIIAYYESTQVAKELGEKEWMTTSCCPAFVTYIKKNYPDLIDHISTAVSPMIATSQLIKNTDPTAKTVFIGPCTAKKSEINEPDLKGEVDYVLTFEELQALFDAHDIKVEECDEGILDNASYFGRIFARSGGVTDAIKHVVETNNLDIDIKPVVCDGLNECSKNLKLAKFNRLQGNFIEGMACEGGCICGPASLSHGAKDKKEVDKYGKLAIETTVNDAIRIFNMDSLNLNRENHE